VCCWDHEVCAPDLQMTTIKLILLFSLTVLVLTQDAFAGGYHINGKVIDFKIKGNEEYIVVLELDEKQLHERHNFINYAEPITLLVHFNEKLESIHPKRQHIESLNIILYHFSKEKEFEMAFGYEPEVIEGKVNYFECDGLTIYQNHVMAVKWSE